MIDPSHNQNGEDLTEMPRPAQAGGSRVPPVKHRSLQPTPKAAKTRRVRMLRKLRLLNAARKQTAADVIGAIPPAPDPLSP